MSSTIPPAAPKQGDQDAEAHAKRLTLDDASIEEAPYRDEQISGIQDVVAEESAAVVILPAKSETPPPPSLVESDPLSVIPRAREALRGLGRQHRKANVAQLKKAYGIEAGDTTHDNLLYSLVALCECYSEEPRNGFEDQYQYAAYVSKLNDVMANLHAVAMAEPQKYRLRDPENPEKLRGHFYVECADGRNALVPFKKPEKVLNIFDTEWLPAAGTIFFPEISVPNTPAAVSEIFHLKPGLKQKIFARMKFLYGEKLKQLIEEFRSGELSTIWFEYQGHFDGEHFPGHGCGAHKSDINAAQLETLKNCFLTDAWLKESYPDEYKKGAFNVFRTCHDTGEGRPIYTAAKIDDEKMADEKKHLYAQSLEYAHKHFEAPHLADKNAGVVRQYYGNPTGIDMAEHDEQTIRISNLHFASTLMGQSVMEVSWIEDAETLYQHVKVLLSIIKKNFRNPAAWEEKEEEEAVIAKKHHKKRPPRTGIPPAIVHFDVIEGNQEMDKVFHALRNKLIEDNEIAQSLKNGELAFHYTVTNRDTYKSLPYF
jgi:hypothetical protein